MVNMGQSPIPHYYYNGVVWEESSCGGRKERHRKARKWRETQRAVCEDKKAALDAKDSAEGQEAAVGTKSGVRGTRKRRGAQGAAQKSKKMMRKKMRECRMGGPRAEFSGA